MSVYVLLTDDEIREAVQAATERHLYNRRVGANPRYGAGTHNDWQIGIEGVLGERALHKHLGLPFDPDATLGDYKAKDAGDRYQVRTSPKPSLILHPDDDPRDIFVFANGVNGSYRLAGWAYGWQVKRTEYWKDPTGGRPAYFVPQGSLNPISTLPKPQRAE